MVSYCLSDKYDEKGFFLLADMENKNADDCVVMSFSIGGFGFILPEMLGRSCMNEFLDNYQQLLNLQTKQFTMVINDNVTIKGEVSSECLSINIITSYDFLKTNVYIRNDIDSAEEFMEPNYCIDVTPPVANDLKVEFDIISFRYDKENYDTTLIFRNSIFNCQINRIVYLEYDIKELYCVLFKLLRDKKRESKMIYNHSDWFDIQYEGENIRIDYDCTFFVDKHQDMDIQFYCYLDEKDIRNALCTLEKILKDNGMYNETRIRNFSSDWLFEYRSKLKVMMQDILY